MKWLKLIFFATSLLILMDCSLISAKRESADFYNITPADASDENDSRWASYLSKHLDKRCKQSNAVKLSDKEGGKKRLEIVINLNEDETSDYKIEYKGKTVTLSARTDDAMVWLLYQFIETLNEQDDRFEIADLPFSRFKFGENISGSFAFEYRSIYSQATIDPEIFPIYGVGSLDNDWAIWGHNLHKVIEKPSSDMLASVNGVKTEDQYCFSSAQLFKSVEKYIYANYGNHKKGNKIVRTVIMPNDNDIVCLCSSCRAKGNTPKSATPAVTDFVERLAHRFPDFQFYTSCYLTTSQLPDHALKNNVGVIISTMDLPMAIDIEQSPSNQDFTTLFDKWSNLSKHLYVWDYSRNFDDYLTPYPFLNVAQTRLNFYKNHGVDGVIFNGSGSDYATFDDMQTYTLANLLINPQIDIKSCYDTYFAAKYPVSGKQISAYYTSIEDRCKTEKKVLPVYGGIEDAIHSFLQPEEFVNFYNNLDKASKDINGEERTRLNKILTALSFTRLEIGRVQGIDHKLIGDRKQFIENLKGHTAFEDITNFKEAHGKLDDYINYMENHVTYDDGNGKNLILEKKIQCQSELDEGSKPASVLTDGFLGIPYDYHTGWLIYSGDKLKLQIQTTNEPLKLVRIGALQAAKWHIGIPATIEVWQNERKIKEIIPPITDDSEFNRETIDINVSNAVPGKPIQVYINKSELKIAIDEVELIKR